MTTRGAAGVQGARSSTSTERAPSQKKRRKKQQGTDSLSELPEELLSTILGFLDVLTLCTARLVCKNFHQSAAMHVKALQALRLDCTARLPRTDFTQFTGMMHLAVTLANKAHLRSLKVAPIVDFAHSRIAPVVTHVCLENMDLRSSRTGEELAASLVGFPKLRSLSLHPHWTSSCDIPLFPPELEELKVTNRRPWTLGGDGLPRRWCGVGDASSLTRCSKLTSLAIDLRSGAGPSLRSLSSLRHLRTLAVQSSPSAMGVLSTFTALTSLTFVQDYSRDEGFNFEDLGRLTGLSRLSLEVGDPYNYMTHEQLACIAQLTQLTCLELSDCWLPEDLTGDSTALAPLMRLVSFSVRLPMGQFLVSGLRVEALQSLTLDEAELGDASFLRRATRLTHLQLGSLWDEGLCGVGNAIARMSGLRSLTIHWNKHGCGDGEDPPAVIWLSRVLQACTQLTKLDYAWESGSDRDIKACASLPGLRSLSFRGNRALTPAIFPTLQAMSGLTQLLLADTGIRVADMTPDVIAAFNARRLQMGWPLL